MLLCAQLNLIVRFHQARERQDQITCMKNAFPEYLFLTIACIPEYQIKLPWNGD